MSNQLREAGETGMANNCGCTAHRHVDACYSQIYDTRLGDLLCGMTDGQVIRCEKHSDAAIAAKDERIRELEAITGPGVPCEEYDAMNFRCHDLEVENAALRKKVGNQRRLINGAIRETWEAAFKLVCRWCAEGTTSVTDGNHDYGYGDVRKCDAADLRRRAEGKE